MNQNQVQGQWQQQPQPQPQPQRNLNQVKKELDEVVYNKISKYNQKGEIDFPLNYSYQNALKAAWLILQTVVDKFKKPALQVCTQESIANTLFEMVVLGLDPVKNQCYFIVKGNQLTLDVSYFGHMAITKRVAGVKEIFAQVVYEGDNVDYEIRNGRITNVVHKQKFGNINKENIIGAYCVIEFNDGTDTAELMTMDEIHQAWGQSPMLKNGQKEGSTHQKFRQEMAKKTVIKRACKKFLNSSDNADLMARHVNEADERASEATVLEEIATNANTVPLDFELETASAAVIEAPQPAQSIVHDDTFTHETVQQQPHIESPNLVDKAYEESPFPEPELVQVPIQSQQQVSEQYMVDESPY